MTIPGHCSTILTLDLPLGRKLNLQTNALIGPTPGFSYKLRHYGDCAALRRPQPRPKATSTDADMLGRLKRSAPPDPGPAANRQDASPPDILNYFLDCSTYWLHG